MENITTAKILSTESITCVKVFSEVQGPKLETAINDWLKDNQDIIIVTITQSAGKAAGKEIVNLTLFYYKDITENWEEVKEEIELPAEDNESPETEEGE